MKLYYTPGACSLAPHIVAKEAGLDVALERVDLAQHRTETGEDYYTTNPKGSVPALRLDDGELLTENAVVLQFLAAQAPDAGLMPGEGMARWRLLELVNFIATELHKGFGPLFIPGAPEELRRYALKQLKRKFELLEQKLGDKPYLTGEAFTIADAYAFVPLTWPKRLNVEVGGSPRLDALRDRIAARPAVRQALSEEGLA